MLVVALGSNSSLKRLEYATTQMCSPFDDHCHQVSATADGACLLVHSLAKNDICRNGEMSGIVALCDMLKTNSSLCELGCVLLAPWVYVDVLAFRRLLSAANDILPL